VTVARAGDESTRDRMIAAAVATIVDEGYYRASSNRIATRAGVTWGVIQYHFGTREQLLVAVVRAGSDELLALLGAAEISGDTVDERVESLVDVIWTHYRRPEFLAHLQILLNLSKDPKTSADTVAALAESERSLARLWQDLVDQVVPEAKRDLGMVIFELVRGVAIGDGLIEALPRRSSRNSYAEAARASLVRAITLLVQDE
jgi:TetR/AcrR family transcriptional regulator, regulator of cefoperazone and chloramphenicol sensitivity